MSKGDKSFVIAITGASGAGKTSVVNAVTALLNDAVAFYFDHYSSTHQEPENTAEWIKGGLDPHEWKNPRLLEDLRLLSYGKPITPPNSDREIRPAQIIVMEEPFGRSRKGMKALVDFVACIDVPLEIALARSIHRDLGHVIKGKSSEWYVEHLRKDLDWYLNKSGREMYHAVNEKAKEDCHLILDGKKTVSELAQEVVLNVNRMMRKEQ